MDLGTGEIHISAQQASDTLIRSLIDRGFEQDQFTECVRCTAPIFHATYRGDRKLPDDSFWSELTATVGKDDTFNGCMEAETTASERYIDGLEASRLTSTDEANISRLNLVNCEANLHKECDIHVRLSLSDTSDQSIRVLESVGLSSFDRLVLGQPHRVFTATFEKVEDGKKVFNALYQLLMISGAKGKIKLESTEGFLRSPRDSIVLPIAKTQDAQQWIKQNSGLY